MAEAEMNQAATCEFAKRWDTSKISEGAVQVTAVLCGHKATRTFLDGHFNLMSACDCCVIAEWEKTLKYVSEALANTSNKCVVDSKTDDECKRSITGG